jgi:hypothetical protein
MRWAKKLPVPTRTAPTCCRENHPFLINGIPTNLAEREDLIDRTVTFAFDYLGEAVRSDDAFWSDFKAMWSKLLGCLLDGVVGALHSRREFGNNNDKARQALLGDYRPRFVDHVVWGEAACRELASAPLRSARLTGITKAEPFYISSNTTPFVLGSSR